MTTRVASRRPGSQRRSALTLLELVVVMAVLVALAGLAVPMFDNTTTQVSNGATIASMRQLQQLILNRYAADMKGTSDGSGTYFYDSFPRATANVNVSQPQLVWLFNARPLPIRTIRPPGSVGMAHICLLARARIQVQPKRCPTDRLHRQTVSIRACAATFGNFGDQTVLDGWGDPIVIVYIQESSPSQTYYFSASPYHILLSAGQNGTLDPLISSAAIHTAVPATITLSTSNTTTTAMPTLNIGSSQYQYWLPLQ